MGGPFGEIRCYCRCYQQTPTVATAYRPFTRAFKAWSGTTPARWRAERGGR